MIWRLGDSDKHLHFAIYLIESRKARIYSEEYNSSIAICYIHVKDAKPCSNCGQRSDRGNPKVTENRNRCMTRRDIRWQTIV